MSDNAPQGYCLRPPAAVWWAVIFDVTHIAFLGVVFAGVALGIRSDAVASGGPTYIRANQAALLALAVLLFGLIYLLLNLRRLRSWVWLAQLVVLWVTVGLAPLPGLIWVPLMIAWCGQPTRDWFDPPLRREFG